MLPSLLWLIVSVLFLIGLAGIFIPALPGILLVFAGILLYAIATDFVTVTMFTVLALGGVALLAWLADWAGAALGARAGGGRWPTVLGSVAGMLVGLTTGGPLGMVVGAFLGALTGALYEGKDAAQAGRAALFSLVGLIGATVVQLVLALGMIGAFLLAVLW